MTTELPMIPLAPTSRGCIRIVVVSHACTVDVNRDVYRELAEAYGREVHVIVPSGWPLAFEGSDETSTTPTENALPVYQFPVRLAGRIQQHFYRWRHVRAAMRTLRPDVLLIEEEPFSIAGTQWAAAARRYRVPYALQAAENLTGRVPRWLLPVVKRNLIGAGLVMARSHSAVSVARGWGATGAVEFLPHALPEVLTQQLSTLTATSENEDPATHVFTIGFAGRLVAEKGIEFLVEMLLELEAPAAVRLLVAGRGPEDHRLVSLSESRVVLERMTLSHDHMGDFYRQLDVLVVPSRTTPTWAEQFGRVITEAACFGVPTIGSDSGEISWVIRDLGAGEAVPEDAKDQWRAALLNLMQHRSTVDPVHLRDRALARYSASAVAARTNTALEEWIGES